MRKLFYAMLSATTLMLAACNPSGKPENAMSMTHITAERFYHIEVPDSLKFDPGLQFYSQVKVDIQWPDSLSSVKNAALCDTLLHNVFPDTPEGSTLDRALASFFDTVAGFPPTVTQQQVDTVPADASAEKVRVYYKEIVADTLYCDAHVLCYNVEQSGYEGGAHGYYVAGKLTYDLHKACRVRISDLVSDQDAVLKLIIAQLVKSNNLKSPSELEKNGVIFSLDDMFVPENFYFTPQSVVFYYNPYEIASWAQGPITVEIDRRIIRPTLSDYGKTLL